MDNKFYYWSILDNCLIYRIQGLLTYYDFKIESEVYGDTKSIVCIMRDGSLRKNPIVWFFNLDVSINDQYEHINQEEFIDIIEEIIQMEKLNEGF